MFLVVLVETQETWVGVEVGGVGRGEGCIVPGLGRSSGVGNDSSFQYSCLENSIDRGIWQATVHEDGVRHDQVCTCSQCFFNLFIWLCRVLVVARGNFDLHCRIGIFSCGMWALSCSMWDLVPWPGVEPRPLHWECGVLATGPPGKSLSVLYIWVCLRLQVSTASKFRLDCEATL